MRTAAGDPNPRRAPLPPSHRSLLLRRQRTERKGKGRWGGEAKAGLKVTVSHCERTASRKAPLHLFVLTCLYVLFHLKVPTTDSETEMDRETGRGTENCAICQNGATMLTAAVCVNISVGRRGKMTILKYDRWELYIYIFHSIKV